MTKKKEDDFPSLDDIEAYEHQEDPSLDALFKNLNPPPENESESESESETDTDEEIVILPDLPIDEVESEPEPKPKPELELEPEPEPEQNPFDKIELTHEELNAHAIDAETPYTPPVKEDLVLSSTPMASESDLNIIVMTNTSLPLKFYQEKILSFLEEVEFISSKTSPLLKEQVLKGIQNNYLVLNNLTHYTAIFLAKKLSLLGLIIKAQKSKT